MSMTESKSPQLLHLVFGGELDDIKSTHFRDLSNLDIVGIFPNFAEAKAAWKAKAQQTVDNAQKCAISSCTSHLPAQEPEI